MRELEPGSEGVRERDDSDLIEEHDAALEGPEAVEDVRHARGHVGQPVGQEGRRPHLDIVVNMHYNEIK